MRTICALLAAQQVTAYNLKNASRQLPSLAQLAEGQTLEEFNLIQLDAHNEYRNVHGADALAYDETLAQAAQEWAESLAAAGDELTHSEAIGYGENLIRATDTDALETTALATDAWYGEVDATGYNFEDPGYNTNPGTGHFTQVVW